MLARPSAAGHRDLLAAVSRLEHHGWLVGQRGPAASMTSGASAKFRRVSAIALGIAGRSEMEANCSHSRTSGRP
jgi:hypothetical protein